MPSALQDALRAPAFIRRLFSQFPLVIHPVDPPPMCMEDFQPSATRQHSINHTLYSFTDSTDSSIASFNPTCLKWQTYLKIRNIPFKTQPSNNHASPSGSLPFLTISSQSDRISQIIPSPKLAKWIEEHAVGSVNTVDTDDGDYRAFSSLVEGAVRDAWVPLTSLLLFSYSSILFFKKKKKKLMLNYCFLFESYTPSTSTRRTSPPSQFQNTPPKSLSGRSPKS
ncbi:hypothetical protein TWF225_007963 [Orbilia oligospora]|nr:hypothetical protein TWF225_007963 [Orbilia oligospora]KAF3232159.1 hypothetical protein TWF128_004459 [Orbilia oligospora]KAF3235300.1 hypothetical protein TWF217_003170 [Orbilia oligospora]KAF3279629.1 hypothetical protein TWF132_012043 [Orbilia oligospora]